MNSRKKIIAFALVCTLSSTAFTQNYAQSWYTDRYKAIAALSSCLAVYLFAKAATRYKKWEPARSAHQLDAESDFLAKKHFKVGLIAALTAGLTYWQTC